MVLFCTLRMNITMKTNITMKMNIMKKKLITMKMNMMRILVIYQILTLSRLRKDSEYLKLVIGVILVFLTKTQKVFLAYLFMVKVMKATVDTKKKLITMKTNIMRKTSIMKKKPTMKKVSTKVKEFSQLQSLMFLILRVHI